jgi:hypothetical protein
LAAEPENHKALSRLGQALMALYDIHTSSSFILLIHSLFRSITMGWFMDGCDIHSKDLDGAKRALTSANRIAPTDKPIKQLLDRVNAEVANFRKKESEKYKRMFG